MIEKHLHRAVCCVRPLSRATVTFALLVGLLVGTALPVTAFVAIAALLPLPALAQESTQQSAVNAPVANRALFKAVDKKDLPGVRAAIEGGADINSRNALGQQAVDIAIDRGYFDIAHYLISVRNAVAANAPDSPITSAESEAWAARVTTPTSKQAAAPAPSLTQPQVAAIAPPGATPPAKPEIAQKPEPETMTEVAETIAEPQTAPEPPVVGAAPKTETMAEVAQLAQAPETAPKPPIVEAAPEPEIMAEVAETIAEPQTAPEPPSATWRFFSTFTDFFEPPNTSGIVRAVQPPTDIDPLKIKTPVRSAVAPREDDGVEAQAVAEQLRELEIRQGELAPTRAPARAPSDTDDGRGTISGDGIQKIVKQETPSADDDILALVAEDTPDPGDPDEFPDDLLGLLGNGDEPSDLKQPDEIPLEFADAEALVDEEAPDLGDPDEFPDDLLGLLGNGDEPSDLKLLDETPLEFAKTQETPESSEELAAEALDTDEDPFAEDPFAEDPFAEESIKSEVDVAQAPTNALDGLEILSDGLEPAKPPEGEDWAITELESASLPADVVARPKVFNPTGKILDGVTLVIGEDVHVGQEITESRLVSMEEDTIHRPCAAKGVKGQTLFCVETLFWPLDLEEYFQVDTIMYQGTRAIARYDGGRATNFHVLFGSDAFDTVVSHFIETYGQPTKSIARTIAPLASPRQENPTMLWQSREAGTDQVVNLEVRKFDDARGGFPDIDRGVVLLYKSHSKPIFPELSQLELMVLRPEDQASASLGVAEPATPESVW